MMTAPPLAPTAATRMQLFERNADVDRLASILGSAHTDEDRVLLQTTLAWYLRQRDNARACALVADTRQRLESLALPPTTAAQLAARLALVDAETRWLQSELESALLAASAAQETFQSLQDPVGCADAQAIIASIHCLRDCDQVGQYSAQIN